MDTHYDLIVIGSGPGGYPAAISAAQQGKHVAVVEKDSIGGTCLNTGCIPMKTLLHTSSLYREVRTAGPIGLTAEKIQSDMKTLQQRRAQIVQTLSSGIMRQFDRYGVTLYRGTAVVTDEKKVNVQGTFTGTLTGDRILITVGSETVKLPVPGIDLRGIESSSSLLERSNLYKSLIIIGGGVIGMEFASLYADFEVPVTVIEAAGRILPAMDREISQNLKMILTKRGADIHTSAKLLRIAKSEGDGFACTYTENETKKTVCADGVLVAVGRRACGTGIFPGALKDKLGLDRGRIPVDESYETAVSGIYAAGDVIGGLQLAHTASAEGLNAVACMYGNKPPKDLRSIPTCVYTDPEIACIGMSADEAKASGLNVRTGKYLMTENGKSVLSMQERGFIKVVAEADSNKVVGIQLMCGRATDIIGGLQLAILRGITAGELASLVMPHPTFCEGIAEAAARAATN